MLHIVKISSIDFCARRDVVGGAGPVVLAEAPAGWPLVPIVIAGADAEVPCAAVAVVVLGAKREGADVAVEAAGCAEELVAPDPPSVNVLGAAAVVEVVAGG